MGYANRAVLALLRSPVRSILDRRICALRYAGRRTGRVYTLPVQYARTEGGVLIEAGYADRKSWWRNMRTATPVQIFLDGAWHDATARLLPDAQRGPADEEYRAVFHNAQAGSPIVKVTWAPPAGRPQSSRPELSQDRPSKDRPLPDQQEPPQPLSRRHEASPPEPLRGRPLLAAWTGWVTAGEAAGFAVPAVVGALTVDAPAIVSVPALLAAGAVEGAVLGAAQAHVLRRALPHVPGRQWVARTSVAAVAAYALALIPSTVGSGWPAAALLVYAAVAGTSLLLSIGVAQWTVLRFHVRFAGRWIAITAAAWLAGLAVFMLVASPLWQAGQPVALTVLIGVFAGILMALTAAVVTGIGLQSILSTTAASYAHRD